MGGARLAVGLWGCESVVVWRCGSAGSAGLLGQQVYTGSLLGLRVYTGSTGLLGLRAYTGSAGLYWVCGSLLADPQVCGCVGLWGCGYVGTATRSVGLLGCASVRLLGCGSVGFLGCGSVGLWGCGFVGLGVVGLWVCRVVGR
jgi:hypothetical protein